MWTIEYVNHVKTKNSWMFGLWFYCNIVLVLFLCECDHLFFVTDVIPFFCSMLKFLFNSILVIMKYKILSTTKLVQVTRKYLQIEKKWTIKYLCLCVFFFCRRTPNITKTTIQTCIWRQKKPWKITFNSLLEHVHLFQSLYN